MNDPVVLFLTFQFSISTQFSSIWPIGRTLSDATTLGQSRPGSNANKKVLCFPQSYSITGASSSDCLMSYPGHLLGESYPSAEMHFVYSAALANLGHLYNWDTLQYVVYRNCAHHIQISSPSLFIAVPVDLIWFVLLVMMDTKVSNYFHPAWEPVPRTTRTRTSASRLVPWVELACQGWVPTDISWTLLPHLLTLHHATLWRPTMPFQQFQNQTMKIFPHHHRIWKTLTWWWPHPS